MRRGVPNRKSFNDGQLDIGTGPYRYVASLANSVDLADIAHFDDLADNASNAEIVAALKLAFSKANTE